MGFLKFKVELWQESSLYENTCIFKFSSCIFQLYTHSDYKLYIGHLYMRGQQLLQLAYVYVPGLLGPLQFLVYCEFRRGESCVGKPRHPCPVPVSPHLGDERQLEQWCQLVRQRGLVSCNASSSANRHVFSRSALTRYLHAVAEYVVVFRFFTRHDAGTSVRMLLSLFSRLSRSLYRETGHSRQGCWCLDVHFYNYIHDIQLQL